MNTTLENAAILFVDDESKAQKYFARLFAKQWCVHTASSYAEAVKLLQDPVLQMGVLVTDQRMPGEDGTALLKWSRKHRPQIVRVLTTAYADVDSALDAINNGEIFRYVLKPWALPELRTTLREAMAHYEKRQQEQHLLNQRREAMLLLAANIAHEIRTPLLSIRAAAVGVAQYLPDLLAVYEQALENGKMNNGDEVPYIRPSHRRIVSKSLASIESEIRRVQNVIDMLLMNVKPHGLNTGCDDIQGISSSIEEALERYPFVDDQRSWVDFDCVDDFSLRGSKILLIHVFFNLIKNALYAITQADQKSGQIVIKSESLEVIDGGLPNQVRIRDNGVGISAEELPKIFNDFFSSKQLQTGTGMGIGLVFCRRAMTQMDGEIECHSEQGVFTEFCLSFPCHETVVS